MTWHRNNGVAASADAALGEDREKDVDAVCGALIDELFGGGDVDPSLAIYPALAALYESHEPRTRDELALAPCPTVNRCLGRLVEILRSHYDHGLSGRSDERRRLDIMQRLLARVRGDAGLATQARLLRRFAGLAETAMEHHYSRALFSSLSARTALADLDATPGVSGEARLRACLRDFPYVSSYRALVAAELELLRSAAPPLLLRDREIAQLEPMQQALAIKLQRDLAALVLARTRLRSLTAPQPTRLALVGCGPLPMTAFFWHVLSGSDVLMIDRDRTSLDRAEALTRELERLQVLRPSALQTLCADAAELRFVPFGHPAAQQASTVACDSLLIASLVDAPTKLSIAQRLSRDPQTASLALLLRSAAALSAELAYEPIATQRISELQLPFCGESVPRNLVFEAEALNALEIKDVRERAALAVTSGSARELLVRADPSVINTTELFRRLPLALSTHKPTSIWNAEALRWARKQLHESPKPAEDLL